VDRVPRYVASFSEGEGVHLRLYLAQKYVDGPALQDELETRRFDERDARSIAREILAILVDLQALSPPVIHRDVKPANLVRDRDGKLSLVDFGSARDVAKTTGGTLVGTFGYMPVEQLSGAVDESTDVYALGATLVHLLTRRPPWETAPNGALSTTTLSSLSISSSFKKFLARCLAPRDRRFASAREALAALDALGSSQRSLLPSLAISIAKLSAVGEWKAMRLNWAFWCAGATILLLAVARILGGIS
jgi:serine/threonine-protein kinase